MTMTKTRILRRACLGIALVLPMLLGSLTMAQDTSGNDALKRLQQQQQRDSKLRQQTIGEQLRQQSVKTQQQAIQDPQVRTQVDATNQAQYRQYRERRTDLIDHSRNLPRPAEAPVSPPRPAAAASTQRPVPQTIAPTPASASSS